MLEDHSHILLNNLLYSCVDKAERENEQFVPDHSLGYILSGETHFITPSDTRVYKAGTIGLVKRNQLVKSIKVPPPIGEFKAINIFFSQDILRKYSIEKNIPSLGRYTGESYQILSPDPFIKGYFDSLLPYFDEPDRMNPRLTELKTIEAIELVLKTGPEVAELLFDFSEPYKIDLEAFMNEHFIFNVPISQFAKLTGRSLASFKRDFQKIFGMAPQRWLLEKRLEQSHYLITHKKQSPSSVYLDVGFENLSHFSFAFKKFFGYNPSSI